MDTLEKYLGKTILRWSSLSRLGRNRVFKFWYIWLFFVPILAKLLSNLGPDLAFSLFGEEINLHFGLPFSWQMFYFSSVAFSIATIIYQTRCPLIISRYSRFSEFVDEGRGRRELISEVYSLSNKASENRDQILTGFLDYFVQGGASDKPTDYLSLMKLGIAPDNLSELFWFLRHQNDSLHPNTRLISAIFYLIGLAFIFIVIAQGFLYVYNLL